MLRHVNRQWLLAVLVSFGPAALYWSPTLGPFVPHHRLLLASVVLATQVVVITGWTVWRGAPGCLAVVVAILLGLVQVAAGVAMTAAMTIKPDVDAQAASAIASRGIVIHGCWWTYSGKRLQHLGCMLSAQQSCSVSVYYDANEDGDAGTIMAYSGVQHLIPGERRVTEMRIEHDFPGRSDQAIFTVAGSCGDAGVVKTVAPKTVANLPSPR